MATRSRRCNDYAAYGDCRRAYTEEDVSKIAFWWEGRGRWTNALGFSWGTHRVMGGCADTGCRSSAVRVGEREPLRARRGESRR